MKTTLDLPPDLVHELRRRAAHEGRKPEDVAAGLLQRGLVPLESSGPARNAIKGEITLPLFPSSKDAPASRMTIDELLALEQETLHQEDLQRLGLPL